MSDNANVAAVTRFLAAYADGDISKVRELLDPAITWFIPGHHPLAGTKHGVDEVLAFFSQIGDADFKAHSFARAGSGDYVIDYHRGWTGTGVGLDTTWCLVFRFEHGRIKEVTDLSADQHQADHFFWTQFKLAPLPERI